MNKKEFICCFIIGVLVFIPTIVNSNSQNITNNHNTIVENKCIINEVEKNTMTIDSPVNNIETIKDNLIDNIDKNTLENTNDDENSTIISTKNTSNKEIEEEKNESNEQEQTLKIENNKDENKIKIDVDNNKNSTNLDSEMKSRGQNEEVNIFYQTHVQEVGWQNWKREGEMAGTTGRALRLEGICFNIYSNSDVKIKYQTHIQDIGWQNWKNSGEISGTQGQCKRLEGIKIELENSKEFYIAYRVHVESIGWQDWKYEGEMAGTTGRALRLEAIEVKLIKKTDLRRGILKVETKINPTYYSGEVLNVSGWKMTTISNTKIKVYLDGNDYSDLCHLTCFYRQDVIDNIKGYGKFEENNEPGFNFWISANELSEGNHSINILVMSENGERLASFYRDFDINKKMNVIYQTHVQEIGWQDYYSNGEIAGTTGKALRLEAINIKGINIPKGIKVQYQTHIENIGWQDWKNEGEIAGTSGRGLRLEAIRIRLTDNDSYSIKYRTHVENIGWQDWCYDGEASGTFGWGLRLEAIQIELVPKINDEKILINLESPGDDIEQKYGYISGWIMSSIDNVSLKIYVDDTELDTSYLQRIPRNDVLNNIKGYGNDELYNRMPGFSLGFNYQYYNLGSHLIKIQAICNNRIVQEVERKFRIRKVIEYNEGVYGKSGLKNIGDARGENLKYYKFGCGENVMFATFAIHGFEDKWSYDGWELVEIANRFRDYLLNNKCYDINEKWTVYIFPGVNIDGLRYGVTQNGPGRTTLVSDAEKGVDLNRCWSTNFQPMYNNRNYTGNQPFLACEARYLRDFMLANKSKAGQTILVDLHGWEQQLIGDNGICYYYGKQFPENNRSSVERYGTGYLIGWARSSLGNYNRTARTALIELPDYGVNSHQDVIDKRFCERYINATIDMLMNLQ